MALWLGVIWVGASSPGVAAARPWDLHDEPGSGWAEESWPEESWVDDNWAEDNSADETWAEPASEPQTVGEVADWVIATSDNGGLPFVIIDKVAAEVFVFGADGRLRGVAPALLGLARGDDSVPGIGDRPVSSIRPEERTTPAGRFVAGFGPALGGQSVIWVDYADSISLHPVVTNNPREQRLQRLESPTPDDNRITYGCINVPPAFYEDVVRPAFTGALGVVYILPEAKPLAEVLPAFHAQAAAPEPAGQPADQLAAGPAARRGLAPE